MQRSIIALCLLLSLAGCASSYHTGSSPLTPEMVAFIQPGITTRQQVMERIGRPAMEYADSSNLTITTTVTTIKNEDGSTTTRSTVAPRALIATYRSMTMQREFLKGTKINSQIFTVKYDANGVVIESGFTRDAEMTSGRPTR